jgi:single-stranded-DNA-specific exonuclease
VVARDGWHPGVIGIVASRLVEKYHRPALVIALEGASGKGSGRSIKGFNLFAALESCKDHLEEFGGHEQAVGFSVKKECLEKLREGLNEHAFQDYSAETFLKKVSVDMEIKLEDLKRPFVDELELLEPHGVGNPRPVFLSRSLQIKGAIKCVSPQTLQFWVTNGSCTYEATASDSRGMNLEWVEKEAVLDLAYSVKKRAWDGIENLVLEVKDALKPQR